MSPWASCANAARPSSGITYRWSDLRDPTASSGIEERRNELRRPAIANVDQAIIVMSTLIPDYSPLLIDRLIFQICYANIQPSLCVTKMDLIDADSWIHRSISEYRASGYTVVESGGRL